MSENKKNYTLLNKEQLKELGGLISNPTRDVIVNPISNTISKKATEHMIIGKDMDVEKYQKTTDTHEGGYLAPTDKVNDATQNSDYAIEPPTSFSRLFAVQNLPLAWRITFGVGRDCWKSGDHFPFSFVIPKDVEIEEIDWSDSVTKVMRDIGFFESGPQHMSIGEMDGEGLLILLEEGFDWEKTDVRKPRDPTKPIVGTISIPMFYVYRGESVQDWTNEGLPRFWHINVNSLDGFSRQKASTYTFHHSRIIHYNPDPLDTSTKGLCTLERAWQAICIGFNIDVGIGEAFFRWGIGHPVFETEFDSIEDLKAFMTNLGSPNRRTWHALLRGMKLNFAGAAGTTLDFTSGKETAVYDEISIATGIPRPILKGEVAGVQTGSEVNERTYWGVLRQKQTAYNKVIWKLVAILNQTGQVNIEGLEYDIETGIINLPENVIVKWAVHYVETEEQRVDILIKKLNVINPLKDIWTINEVRAFSEDLLNLPKGTIPALPAPVGNQILSIYNDPFDLEQSLAEQQLSQANLPSEPKDNKMGPDGQLEGNTPTEKLTTLTGGEATPTPPSQPRLPGAERPKSRDDDKIIGCPNHSNYHRSCPACVTILHLKEQMARDLLDFGYSVNEVQSFTNLNRNKVNLIRQELTELNRKKKN